jgi:DNA-binding SARP family transcriptional activator
MARQRAILLCVDDFHLTVDPFIRLLQGWLSGIRFEPIGWLLTVRTPVERPLLYDLMRRCEEYGIGRTVELRPLSVEQIQQLIAHWRPSLAEDEQLVQILHERTRGSPLFLIEILRHAEMWESQWHTQRDLSLSIPTSLRAVLMQRAEALSARERELLNWLSCFESAIPVEILPPLLNANERRVVQGLHKLLETGWLEHLHGQPSTLAWRHPLTREAIYEAIPRARRAFMHRQIAEQLERLSCEGILLPDEQRWLHWIRSEPDEVVLTKLWEAHQQARLRSHPRFRLELLEACLQVAKALGDLPKRVQLMCERPYLMFCLSDGLLRALDASQQAIAELEAHPECDPDRSLWIQVHCARAGQLIQLGRAEEARTALQSLLQQGSWSEEQQSMLELTLAYLHACQGDLRAAHALHRIVWQRMHAQKEWWRRWAGVLHYTLRYALACGDIGTAQEVASQFSEWANHSNAPPAWKELWHLMQAELAYFEGRGAEQLYHARATRPSESTTDVSSLSYEIWFHTLLYRDPTEAQHVVDRALAVVRQAIGYEREAEWLLCRAQAQLEAERFADAQATLQEARRLARKIGNQLLIVRSYLLQAQLALLTPHNPSPSHAHDLLAEAEPMICTLDLPELWGEWHRLCSVWQMEQGELTAALQSAWLAVECADGWGHALYRGLAYLQLAAVLQDAPQSTNTNALTEQAALEHAESLLSGYGKPLWWRRKQQSHRTIEWVSERGWEIEVRMLGEVRVCFRGRELAPDGWISPRTRALFCHLVLTQGRPLHTDSLCEHHFPHLDFDRARVNLQTTISAVRRSLRRALGEQAGDWIRHESGFYRWAPEHSWTADAFEFERIARDALALTDQHAQQERLEEALQLYRGDLLWEYAEEEWCLPHFHRLRALYLECLLKRAQLASLMGQHTQVIEYGERLLQLDPCDEAAARLLMQAYCAVGRRADALQVYARCQKSITELLEGVPSEPTRQLYAAILKD